MNNFSKKEWIDLVFDGRNKSYGAYELRAQSGNIMLKALFVGIILVASLISIPVIASYGSPTPIATTEPEKKPSEERIIPFVSDKKPKKQEEPIKIPEDEPAKKLKEKSAEDIIKHREPQITDKVTVDEELKSVDELEGQKTGAEDIKGSPDGKIDAVNPSDENVEGDIDGIDEGIEDGTVFADFALDKKAEFPGGIQNFMKAVQRSYRVPDIQAKQYTVYVSFVVEIDGSISNIEVITDPGYGLGQEAIRTLKSIKTKWEPGIYQGKPVRMQHYLPIKVTVR